MDRMKATIGVALLLLLTTTGGFAQLRENRNKNGVRLNGGSGPRGRVELSSVNAWFTNYSTSPVKPAWNAVCDEAFDDSLALVMCTLLGYAYGRKAYDPKFNYKKVAPVAGPPIGRIICQQRVAVIDRRLRSIATDEAALSQSAGRGTSRSLYEPLWGKLRTPARAPYTCEFYGGSCDVKGPLAGIECSHTPMPAAPPPPPSPPLPPPSPPAPSTFISLVGGRPVDLPEANPEPNLACAAGGPPCEGYGRLELLVPPGGSPGSPTAAQLWAPVCAITDEALAFSVRYVACQQALDWPEGRSGIVVMTTEENPAFTVPTAPASSRGDFNVSKYGGWVTVRGPGSFGGGYDGPLRLQDFNLSVSATPCKALLAVQCLVYGSNLG